MTKPVPARGRLLFVVSALSVVGLVVAACGGGAGSPAAPTDGAPETTSAPEASGTDPVAASSSAGSASGETDACTVVSLTEAALLLGEGEIQTSKGGAGDGDSVCDYGTLGADRKAVIVNLFTRDTAQSRYDYTKGSVPDATALTGLGDDAFWTVVNGMVHVYAMKNGAELSIGYTVDPDADVQAELALLQTAMLAALARL